MFPAILRAFHEVVRAGSIRKASAVLDVSPSSVSRQVAILERQFGTRLIERTAAGIHLTHGGELVAQFARQVVLDFDSLKLDLDDTRGSRRKLIHLTAVESVLSAGPVRAMSRFRKRFEDVTFRLTLVPAPQVVDMVKKDKCDLGITMSPAPDPAIISLHCVAEPVVLAVTEGHAMATRAAVSLMDLAEMDLAIPDEQYGIRQILDQAALREGVSILPVMTGNSFEAIRAFARAGGGGAVLPSRAVKGAESLPHLISVPIDSVPLKLGEIHVVAHKERRMPRIVRLFMDELIEGLTE